MTRECEREGAGTGRRGNLRWVHAGGRRGALVLALFCAFGTLAGAQRRDPSPKPGKVRPGISVLVTDSAALIAGKRIGLVTNHTGIDEAGRSSVDRVRERGTLVALFSPEHGIRGEEDREDLADGRDPATGVPIYSLYRRTTVGPSDAQLENVDVLVVDLQDIGTRTWTYVGVMLYTMQAAARRQIPVIVCDRPNPITGTHIEGPLLDSARATTVLDTTGRRSNGFALAPMPLRHGLTMGELARYYRGLAVPDAMLHVIPMANWRRAMWFDETGLPWVRPSPNMPSLTSALLYPAIVAFEASNLSVGRGTDAAFQRVGAPWLDADSVAALCNALELRGVRFEAERITPRGPTDAKFDGQELRAVRVVVDDRNRVQPARVGAALLWAIGQRHPRELELRPDRFDERFGSAAVRIALLGGADPESVIDGALGASVAFGRRIRPLLLYR